MIPQSTDVLFPAHLWAIVDGQDNLGDTCSLECLQKQHRTASAAPQADEVTQVTTQRYCSGRTSIWCTLQRATQAQERKRKHCQITIVLIDAPQLLYGAPQSKNASCLLRETTAASVRSAPLNSLEWNAIQN